MLRQTARCNLPIGALVGSLEPDTSGSNVSQLFAAHRIPTAISSSPWHILLVNRHRIRTQDSYRRSKYTLSAYVQHPSLKFDLSR